jgi:hypothetical protein
MARTPHAGARHTGSPRPHAKDSDAASDSVPRSPGEIAEELYSLPPEEFIRRRDTFVREAKARGDRDAAASVSSLRKPSTGAWLANQLVRAHPAEIHALLDLGAGLREAQSRLEGDQLRELSRRRRQVINGLVRQARQLAAELGKPVGDDVGRDLEQTFEAALSSPESASELEGGRLTSTLVPAAGFGSGGARLRAVPEVKTHERKQTGRRDTAPVGGDAGADAGADAKAEADMRAKAKAEAEATARLAKATTAAETASRILAERESEHGALVARIDSLQRSISELTGQLEQLEQQKAETKRREQSARRALTQAERAARNADLALEAAREDVAQRSR